MKSSSLSLIAIVIGLLPITTASHAADGKDIAANGTANGAPACSSCHGEQGEGQPAAGFPRLAGLNATYIEHQLANFQDNSRKNDTMQPVAAALSDDERKAVATYYAGLNAPKAAEDSAPDPSLVKAGAAIASVGDWSKGLPACGQCHGTNGLGVGASFPGIAGQSSAYIENELTAWKSGERKNDPMGLMANVAKKLDDNQIKAVAAYYASLPVTSSTTASGNKP